MALPPLTPEQRLAASEGSLHPEDAWLRRLVREIMHIDELIDRRRAEDDNWSDLAAHGILHFDAERISGPGDYAALVTDYAAVTEGDWQPVGLTEFRLDPEDADTTVIEFEHRDAQIRWTVEGTASDWVQPDFYDAVDVFTVEYLPGRFLQLPTGDQTVLTVYLTAPKLTELASARERPRDAGTNPVPRRFAVPSVTATIGERFGG